MLDKRTRFVRSLNQLADEVSEQGLDAVEIEDGELAYILRQAADLINQYAPEDLCTSTKS